MQSSAMVAIRTMIMITCLVAVPLAAVFGTALPKVFKSAFGGREQSFSWDHSGVDDEPRPPSVLTVEEFSSPQTVTQADIQSIGARQAPRLPTAHITGVRAIDDAAAAQAVVETAPLWNPPPRTAQAPKSRDMTAHFAPSPVPRRIDEHGSRNEPRTEALQKTVYSQPHKEPPLDESSDDDSQDADQLVPVERPAGENALSDGERRLRQLGATYYRLETWGGDGHLYRCSCNIAVNPGSRATRHFEAIEAAPSQAIGAVIKQVDTWRERRVRK
jgi:hypothetical protein